MKFSIAKSTIKTGNELCAEFNTVVHSALDIDAPITAYDEVMLTNEFENFSITADDQNYVFEMNDECVLRFMRFYIKAAKLLAPIVKACINLAEVFKTDVSEINEFIGKRKFHVAVESASNVFCGANGWYFCDETDRPAQGVFFTREAAIAASDKYFEQLEAKQVVDTIHAFPVI